MIRYIPLTDIDSNAPALWIDTQAPLGILHDAAVRRIRAVTEALEEFANEQNENCEASMPSYWAKVLAVQLRDGCDLLDVLGKNLHQII